MNIVFDIGNVLLRWDLWPAFEDEFATPAEMTAYLDEIGFHDWNLQQDRGRSWAEAHDDLRARHGARAEPATRYAARHALTIQTPITGTWALLDRLAPRHSLFAITNWSAETWADALRLHPRLGQVFRDIVISGREKLAKPDPAIFRLFLDRNGLAAGDCLFIDDNAANVAAAREVGMDAVRFTDPEALERDLTARGLL
ncbi:HAD family phosphatase [Paracoccus suum]|uniref:HAD family phosphatase n=1 Tax=Paracoccus suum TaxID=2259340 RepID=A0A344PH23_9RHOB|nr:HAD-IA family hydrolase [Paracoccus suum]AXC48678.1 HAD family phosphatase [Paracoccus suum]